MLDAFTDPEMARQGDVTNPDQASAWIGDMTPNRPDRHIFAVDLAGAAIGAVGISAIDRENRTGWFWYWLHRAHRGRRTASRAATTVAN